MLLYYGYGLQNKNWIVNENHSPGYSRVYYIVGGTVTYSDEYRTKKLVQGNLYIFPSHAPFSIIQDREDPINCVWMHLNLFPTLVRRLIEITPNPNSTSWNIITAIKSEITQNPSRKILEILCESFISSLERDGILSSSPSKVSAILSYIYEHYQEPLTLKNIGDRFGYSHEHIVRLLKQHIGITPYQYIKSVKLSESVLLLKENIAIEEIAKKVGYCDGKSLSNAFKGHYGIAPDRYRKQFLNKA